MRDINFSEILFGRSGFGNFGGIDAILKGLKLEGETVRGRDAVLTALEKHLKAKDLPDSVIQSVKSRVANSIDESGADKDHVIATFGEKGVYVSGVRLGGDPSSLGEFDLAGARKLRSGDPFSRPRENAARTWAADRLRDALKDHLRAKEKSSTPLAPTFLLLFPVVGAELLKFYQKPDEKNLEGVKKITAELAKVLQEAMDSDTSRFRKLNGYLNNLGFDLMAVCVRASDFSHLPRPDIAKLLAHDLGRLVPALLRVMLDAGDRAKAAFDEALQI